MTDFYRLVERNDNEGETWLYYFPADPEVVRALAIATEYLEDYDFDPEELLDEDDVDFLVDHLSDLGGYKSLVNKVTIDKTKVKSLLKLVQDLSEVVDDEDECIEQIIALLYKGSLFN